MITAHPVIAVITAIIAALVTLYNKCEMVSRRREQNFKGNQGWNFLQHGMEL